MAVVPVGRLELPRLPVGLLRLLGDYGDWGGARVILRGGFTFGVELAPFEGFLMLSGVFFAEVVVGEGGSFFGAVAILAFHGVVFLWHREV